MRINFIRCFQNRKNAIKVFSEVRMFFNLNKRIFYFESIVEVDHSNYDSSEQARIDLDSSDLYSKGIFIKIDQL